MPERPRAIDEELYDRKRAAEKQVKAHFADHPDSNMKAIWKAGVGNAGSQIHVLRGASVALAATNHEELKYLIRDEIRRREGSDGVNANDIFDEQRPDRKLVVDFFGSKPKMLTNANRPSLEERRKEEVAVGKNMLGKLEGIMFFPSDNFRDMQKDAAKFIAELSLTVDGQLAQTSQNLMGRTVIIEHLLTDVMSTLDEENQSEMVPTQIR